MADPSYAGPYTPELNQAVIDELLRKFKESQLQQEAAARGEALTRGISGSSFEGAALGGAARGYAQSSADALTQLALSNAEALRQERITKEGQAFTTGQNDLQRQWQTLEEEKNRAFSAGQNELGLQAQARQAELQRESDRRNAESTNRANLIGGGISGVGGLIGQALGRGRLFGQQAPSVPGQTQQEKTAIPGPGFLAGAGKLGLGALGLGAQVGLSSGAGQLLGKGLFKSNAARTGARRGAQIGSVAGALVPGLGSFGGPIGAVLGGGASTISKGFKKVFCFDGMTPITMADGSTKPIQNMRLGDETKGGRVESVRTAIAQNGQMCQYHAIYVTSAHAVKEGDRWIRVAQSASAVPIPGVYQVFCIVTTSHRIYVKDVEFADEVESDDYENLTIDQSLVALNNGSYSRPIKLEVI